MSIIAPDNVISKAQCAPCGRVSLLLPYFSQNKDLSQCDSDSAISQIRGPQKILCTFGEKEHTSKRVSIIACNNVISKVQCATCVPIPNIEIIIVED